MATKQINIPDIGQVTLFKRRGNRSLRLSIGADGEIRVSLPMWVPYKAGEQFVISKARWIEENRSQHDNVVLRHGHGIGKAHRLSFEPQTMASRVNARIVENEVRVLYPIAQSTRDKEIQAAAHKASIRALRKEAATLLPQRLAVLAGQTGYEYTSVGVKQLKSRWGSCNSSREITLNLYLMQLPWHLIDYVLIHELVHTKVMQHGAPFWAEMEKHLPNARSLRKQMSAYRPTLSPFERGMA